EMILPALVEDLNEDELLEIGQLLADEAADRADRGLARVERRHVSVPARARARAFFLDRLGRDRGRFDLRHAVTDALARTTSAGELLGAGLIAETLEQKLGQFLLIRAFVLLEHLLGHELNFLV